MNNNIFLATGLRWLWLALLLLVLDIYSKQWIMTHCVLGKSIVILPYVNVVYWYNTGAAFSLLANNGGWPCWLFLIITVVIIGILLVRMYHADYRARLSNLAYAMLIGGALGNMFDRIVHGIVIDFIDVYIGYWHWPTFNLADASICIGAILLVLTVYFISNDGQSCSNKVR